MINKKFIILFLLILPNCLYASIEDNLQRYLSQRSPERVYLQFDKPLYEPGNSIWFQAYVRNESNLKAADKSRILHVELLNPKGAIVQKRALIVKNGTVSGDFQLQEHAEGGLYQVKAYTQWQKNDPNTLLFQRKIPVQQVILPKLKMKMDFLRQAYGPGDIAKAKLKLETLSNKPLAGHSVEYVLLLAGKEIKRWSAKSNSDGEIIVKTPLPDDLQTADGLINVLIPYEGQTESIARAIPISLQNINVDIFPEGGDLINGLKSQVAFRATNEFGKPADIAGHIVDQRGQTITRFKSFHNGMGSFKLQPEKGKSYSLVIDKPKNIKRKYSLPESLEKGFVISANTLKNGNLKLQVKGNIKEKMSLMAQMRGKVYFKKSTRGGKIIVPMRNYPMGVLHITLFDSNKIERAERLVFNYSKKRLKISIKSSKSKYLPREKVKLRIRATDHRGVPVPANLSLAVTDDKLISYADDHNGHILSKLLLEPDLKGEVYKPNFYFDEKEKKAKQAMDHLMLTQGWRRFIWKDVLKAEKFVANFPAENTILHGKVLKGNQPVANAKVSVLKSKKTYITDKNGEFSITDLDLYQVQQLQASQGKLRSAPVAVNDYNQFITLYIGRMIRPPMPMMQRAPIEEGMAAAAAAPVEKAKVEKRRDLKKNKQAKAKPKKNQFKDAKLAKKPVAPKQERKRMMAQEAEMDIAIGRFAPRQQPALQAKYQRAREFPIVRYKTTKTKLRQDFRSTIFWQGNIELDRRGRADIEFFNSDEITAFRSVIEGVSEHGLVGRKEYLHYTQLPFSMDLRVPRLLVSGDQYQLPIKLANRTSAKISGKLSLQLPKGLRPVKSIPGQITINANRSKTLYIPLKVIDKIGKQKIKITFASETDEDAFEREIDIIAQGFPINLAITGQEQEKEFLIKTSNVINNSLRANLAVYPSNMSNLLAGIESILREPYGCFEQTSSSTYPNIMIMDYLSNTDFDKPQVMEKAQALIKKGYKRLISFETKEKGYEWFGAAPGHEALTAYGLMEFADMKKIYDGVDADMIQRTAKWLLSKRDGKGGFARNKRALDSFGRAKDEITNAYIVYALSEAGFVVEIKKELDQSVQVAKNNKDPYQLALVTNALLNTRDKRASEMLTILNRTQKEDGSWQGLHHSITRSTGRALYIETTSLAIMANLKSSVVDGKRTKQGVEYLVASRYPGGGFGNTQSTVMALRALTAYAKYAKRTAEPGTIVVKIDGKEITKFAYQAGRQEPIQISGLEKYLTSPEHKINVSYLGVKNPLPYSFNVDYYSNQPPSAKQAEIKLQTQLEKIKLRMGETTRLKVKMQNSKNQGQAMSLAIVGIPAGLSPQVWQLKELQKKKVIDFYEVLGNDLVFYYRQMKPEEKKQISLDLKADLPGHYQGAASRAYLYYSNEHKFWTPGLKVTISK